jgi:hypothetical protein
MNFTDGCLTDHTAAGTIKVTDADDAQVGYA